MKKAMAILTAVLLLTTVFTAAASASAADGILYYDSDLLKTICGTVPPEQWTEDENCRAYMTIIAMADFYKATGNTGFDINPFVDPSYVARDGSIICFVFERTNGGILAIQYDLEGDPNHLQVLILEPGEGNMDKSIFTANDPEILLQIAMAIGGYEG